MFLYLHEGILWGAPHGVYDMAFFKLTDEEVAKLPASEQFTDHRPITPDENGVPWRLGVQFPVTNVGDRFFLSRCAGVTLENLAHEGNVRAILMGKHPRLGENSLLSRLDLELFMQVVELALSE